MFSKIFQNVKNIDCLCFLCHKHKRFYNSPNGWVAKGYFYFSASGLGCQVGCQGCGVLIIRCLGDFRLWFLWKRTGNCGGKGDYHIVLHGGSWHNYSTRGHVRPARRHGRTAFHLALPRSEIPSLE